VGRSAASAFVLQWSSQIVGGPFNGFTGFLNLAGNFNPSAAVAASPTTASAAVPHPKELGHGPCWGSWRAGRDLSVLTPDNPPR